MRGETPGHAPDMAEKPPRKLDRLAVEAMAERGEKNYEHSDLKDLDLAELDLEGASFRGADVRGLILYRTEGEQKKETNIRGTDWTDATFADLGPQTVFQYVNAERATFGFSETLADRRNRLAEAGVRPAAEDTGGFLNFDGRGANFRDSSWRNVDFGGELDADGRPAPGYEALFTASDLSGATFDGASLKGIYWSDAIIDRVTVKDPDSLSGLTIRADQVPALADGIVLTDTQDQAAWEELRRAEGDAAALRKRFGALIIEKGER
jgi:uncharacterized protein YjbI with pentapeptide repeats